MSKPWLGYLSATFLFLAGILQMLGGRPGLGILFIVLAIASVVIQIIMKSHQKNNDQDR